MSVTAIATSPGRLAAVRGQARARPLTTVFLLIFGIFYPSVGLARLLGYSIPVPYLHTTLAVLAVTLLFGSAVLVTWIADGSDGLRLLFRRMTIWRIGWARVIVVVGALPALTLATAAATGTLQRPTHGWLPLAVSYVWDLVVLQALSTNLWEEGLWSGFVQIRLMQRHRILTASLLTSIPFVLVHIPGAFQNVPAADGLVAVIALVCVAPFLRYLAGTLLADTGASVLAVALLHASFNASGHLTAAAGGWQFIPALLILTLLDVAGRRWVGYSNRRQTSPSRPGSPTAAQLIANREEPRS